MKNRKPTLNYFLNQARWIFVSFLIFPVMGCQNVNLPPGGVVGDYTQFTTVRGKNIPVDIVYPDFSTGEFDDNEKEPQPENPRGLRVLCDDIIRDGISTDCYSITNINNKILLLGKKENEDTLFIKVKNIKKNYTASELLAILQSEFEKKKEHGVTDEILLKRLNRAALEEYYPDKTPRQILSKSTYLNIDMPEAQRIKVKPGDVIVYNEFFFLTTSVPADFGAGPITSQFRIPVRKVKVDKKNPELHEKLKPYERSFLYRILERAGKPDKAGVGVELRDNEVKLWNALVDNLYIQRVVSNAPNPQIVVYIDFNKFKDQIKNPNDDTLKDDIFSKLNPKCNGIDIAMYLTNHGHYWERIFGSHSDGAQSVCTTSNNGYFPADSDRVVEFEVLFSALKLQPNLGREEESWSLYDWSESEVCYGWPTQSDGKATPASISGITVREDPGYFSHGTTFQIVETETAATHRVVWSNDARKRSIKRIRSAGTYSIPRIDLARLWPSDVSHIEWRAGDVELLRTTCSATRVHD